MHIAVDSAVIPYVARLSEYHIERHYFINLSADKLVVNGTCIMLIRRVIPIVAVKIVTFVLTEKKTN
ncbi:MAG: hypothetical protein LBU32_11275 [Clostridiales bacterium]|nr:hypothetical protein [Clostridiales bacterium]